MTRQILNIGIVANDTTGDTLRVGGQKINENFVELYRALGGDSDILVQSVSFSDNAIVFEGSTIDAFETTLSGGDPTADRVITLPDAGGTIVTNTATQTLTNKTLNSAVMTTPQLNDTNNTFQYIFTPGILAADREVRFPVLSNNDTLVFIAQTQTLTNKTLTTATLTSPRIVSQINDINDNELLELTPVGSAVNHIRIGNNIAGQFPTVQAAGTDTNITLDFAAKGSGSLRMNSPVAYVPTVQTGSGAVIMTSPLTIFNNASPLAMTMANGTTTGQTKKFLNKNAGVAKVTPTSFANGTSFSIRQNGVTETIWDGSNWFLNTPNNYDSSDNTFVYVTA